MHFHGADMLQLHQVLLQDWHQFYHGQMADGAAKQVKLQQF
jgi:hypothetical protein